MEETLTPGVDGAEEEEEAGKPKPLLPPRELLGKIWFLLAFNVGINIFNMLEANIMLPYLYTRVSCCSESDDPLGEHYYITDPDEIQLIVNSSLALGLDDGGRLPFLEKADEGSDYFIRACSVPVFAPDDEAWSLSPDCVNKGFVTDSAQDIVGWNTPLQKVFCVFLMLPIGGKIADENGRRPVLATYTICCIAAAALFLIDTELHALWGNYAVYAGASLLAASWEPKDSALVGSVADIMGDDEVNKGRALSALFLSNSTGTFLGFCAAYLTLQMHLPKYTWPWLGFTLVGCAVLVVVKVWVPETLPERLRKPVSKEMLNPVASNIHALRILCRDRVLTGIAMTMFWWYFHWVGFIVTAFSFLMLVDFDTGEAVLPATLSTCCQVMMAGGMVKLLPKIGVYNSFILGHFFFMMCYVFWGPFTIFFGEHGLGHIGPYIANVVQAMGFVTTWPAFQTIVSQRVEEYNQSKCNAALLVIGTSGAILGTPFYSKVLFDGTAQGYGKAFPATVSFFQGIGTTLMAVGCKYLASTTKSAVELSREAVAKEKAAQEGNAAPESTTNPIANGESVDK